jgi:hypothetical protein
LAAAAAASFSAALPIVALAQDAPAPHADAPPPPLGYSPEHMDRMDHGGGEWSLDRREQWLEGRIERASDHGALSGNEERRGRTELDAIRGEQARLRARDGDQLSAADHSYIAHRIDELNGTLRWEGRNPPPPWSEQ